MIKHIVRLMWNRKRGNLLIVVELCVTFVVLFLLAAILVYNYRLYNLPLGFDVDNKWTITIQTDSSRAINFLGQSSEDPVDIIAIREQVFRILNQMPEVEAVHTATTYPYSRNNFTSFVYWQGNAQRVANDRVSNGFSEDIGMTLVEGRWFGPQDEGRDWFPIVINQKLKKVLFGDETAVGKEITNPPNPNFPQTIRYRIVGVFEDFRKNGEFAAPYNFVLEQDPLTGARARRNLTSTFSLVLMTKPVNTGEFEEMLYNALQNIQSSTPITGIRVASLAQLQRGNFIENISPILVLALVVAFIMMMVAFGLFGVLWQNVVRRTREIGVRRAMGATGLSIRRQITLEMVVLAVFAVIIGFGIVVQLPISGYVTLLDWPLFWGAFGISALVLITLSILCALYPSWLSTKVDTVDALHYE